MGRLLAIPTVLLALLFGASLWNQRPPEAPADFIFVNRADIRTLDPNIMSWSDDIRLGYAVFEGLYMLDPETLRPVPGTADKIDINDDKTVYTFHLRPEARWSNGDPVQPGDFIFAWRRMMEQVGDYTYLLDYIAGALEYRTAFAAEMDRRDKGLDKLPLPDFAAVGIKELEPRTLQVKLTHPVAYYPDIVAFPCMFPLHEKSMEPFKEVDKKTDRVSYRQDFIRPPHLVGNGPYRLDKWEFKTRIRLVASDFYWDRANVKSRIIDQLIIDDNKLGDFLRYEQGTVDWLPDVDAVTSAELLKLGGRKDLHVFPAFGTYFYDFNCLPKLADGRDNPFADKRIRKAFALAIDREPIVNTITRNGERVAEHYVPDGSFPDYPRPPGQKYDIKQAQALLAEAGYPGGRGFPAVSLLFNLVGQHGEIAQMIARQWQQNLGVTVPLEAVETNQFKPRLHSTDFDIARASWYGDYDDVSTFTDKNLSTSANNDCKWVNAEYDSLCDAATREPDVGKRLAMLSKAEGILLDEAPIIVLYYYTNRYLFHDNIKGLDLNPRNTVMFKTIWKEKR
jgi:oligopeptide transport system substrate-binding protein